MQKKQQEKPNCVPEAGQKEGKFMPYSNPNTLEGSSFSNEEARLTVADMFIRNMVTTVLALTQACATCEGRSNRCSNDFYSNPEGCFCRKYAEELRAKSRGET